jgi:transcriptional regulator with XRE-family HTH domain
MAEFLNNNIKYLRTKKKLSQQFLADQIGVDRSTISRIENNETETGIDNAIKLAEILDVPISDLIDKDLRKEKVYYPNSITHIIYKDPESGLYVAYVDKNGKRWHELPKEEQERNVATAMDALYEYKRKLKEK